MDEGDNGLKGTEGTKGTARTKCKRRLFLYGSNRWLWSSVGDKETLSLITLRRLCLSEQNSYAIVNQLIHLKPANPNLKILCAGTFFI